VPQSLLLTPEPLCFFIQNQQLDCVLSSQKTITILVELLKTSTLSIRIDGEAVFQKDLLVQSLRRNKKRRRVRNPWSFF